MSVIELPKTRKPIETDFSRYLILIYGREKIGKTTLFAQFPDILSITTEPGTKGMEIFEISCGSWRDIREAVALLEKSKRFRSVVIDTVDRAYDMCLDYVCNKRGIEYPGVDSEGRNDYGASWRAVRVEFLEVIHRIVRSGRGVGFTSHAKEAKIEARSGEKYDRVFPTMTKQARETIEALVDFFFYADYMKTLDGETVRVLVTRGDETIWAGTREGVGEFPPLLPLLRKGGYEILEKGFKGRAVGVDPGSLRTHRLSAKPTTALVSKMRKPPKNETSKKKPVRRRVERKS